MQVQEVLQDKRYLFWAIQFIGWSGWGLSHYLGVIFWGEPPTYYALYLMTVAAIGGLITLFLRALYRFMWNQDIVRRLLVAGFASWLAGLAWMACRANIYFHLFPEERKPHRQDGMEFFAYFDGSSSAVWVMLVWSGLYFGIKYYMLLQEEKQRSLKVANMAHEAQLKMLRYQLNPHFLFNTLNAISTLVLDKDTQLANTMVTRLSRFLRYSLDNDPMQKVTVEEEVEALKLYLDIEKVRFDERLKLHFDIEPAAASALMPSLLLQPMVENSIKYAVSQSVNGGSIGISAKVFGNDLLLAVADDGPGLDLRNGRKPTGGGVGISNTRERLKEIYGTNQSFKLGTTEPHGLTTSIRIPLEYKAAKQ